MQATLEGAHGPNMPVSDQLDCRNQIPNLKSHTSEAGKPGQLHLSYCNDSCNIDWGARMSAVRSAQFVHAKDGEQISGDHKKGLELDCG